MTEKEAIVYYRGVLKLVPGVLEWDRETQHDWLARMYQAAFNRVATREHIAQALAATTGNKVKRRWDLKKVWIIGQILSDSTTSNGVLISKATKLFQQRTRTTVVDSCREAATKIPKEKVEAFLSDLQKAMAEKSKDGNVFA